MVYRLREFYRQREGQAELSAIDLNPLVTQVLVALNAGIPGMCTLHANSATDVPARIEALALAAGLTRDAVHSQLAAAVWNARHEVPASSAGTHPAKAVHRGAIEAARRRSVRSSE